MSRDRIPPRAFTAVRVRGPRHSNRDFAMRKPTARAPACYNGQKPVAPALPGVNYVPKWILQKRGINAEAGRLWREIGDDARVSLAASGARSLPADAVSK